MLPYQLSNKWRLAADSNNFMLQQSMKSTNKETGELSTIWVSQHFFGSVSDALNFYANVLIRESTAALPESISMAIKELRSILADLKTKTTITARSVSARPADTAGD